MLIPMKESWQYYTYLRRWQWLLLLGATSDFMVGLVYSNLQVYPIAFDAKATLAIEDLEGFNLTVPVTVQASSAKDAEEAIDSVALSISLLNSNTDLPIITRELAVTRYVDRSGWWKGAVFGAVIGMLLTEDHPAGRRVPGKLISGRQLRFMFASSDTGVLRPMKRTAPLGGINSMVNSSLVPRSVAN